MQSIAAACGSSPAPVCLYMPSSWSWKASSKILCRFRRRNPNSGRTRFRRFMMNSSCFVSSTGGFQRSMVAPRGDKRSYHVTLVDTHVRSDRNHCRINLIGALGVGFSLAGLSAITRCPQNMAQDGVIRGVRYDTGDMLCLDGKRLVPLGPAQSGVLELRTFPDTFTRVLGHLPPGGTAAASALSFEVDMPSGLVIEYGGSGGGTPLAPGGVPQAWLATSAHDGHGNAMAYTYCSEAGEGDGYTTE